MGLINRETVWSVKLPMGAYYYKTVNNKKIYKNKYLNEYYIVYSSGENKWVIEQYSGQCSC